MYSAGSGSLPLAPSVIDLAIVFFLIAVRRIGKVKLAIWQIMLAGAIVTVLMGQISPADAIRSINMDVILFLFGMFVVGAAMEESGYLSEVSYKLFRRSKNVDQLVILSILIFAFLSALLMNDTVAIIGTPLLLSFSKKFGISSRLLLLALAFSVTIGSVASPIGNPQNLLIALGGDIPAPFTTFFLYLAFPTLVNLAILYLFLKIAFKEEFRKKELFFVREPVSDRKLARLSELSLLVIILLIGIKVLTVTFELGFEIHLTWIALLAMLPILFSPRRFEIIRKIDWSTLVFFASMFVLMESVWQSGFFQKLLHGRDITSLPMILGMSVLISQAISNVPFVALFLPLLKAGGAGVAKMMALAAGSTIAGNMFILGAASNVIIIQNAEKKGETIEFGEFARIGIPLTLANFLIYWAFLSILL